jgi:putative inorganic carbon (HCO3(-)) transporter
MSMITAARVPFPLKELGIAALAAIGIALIAGLVIQLDIGPALAVMVGGITLVTIWVSPGLATLLAVFLLYANLPSALRQAVPAAQTLAATFALPLIVPFVHRFIKGLRPVFDLTFVLMVAYLLVMLVSAFGAVDSRVAAVHIGQYVTEGVVLYWLLLQAIRTRVLMKRVLWTVIVAGAFVGSLSLYQQVSGHYDAQFAGLARRQLRHDVAAATAAAERGDLANVTNATAGTSVRTSHRAAGPVGDPNRFAQVLLIGLPWAVFLAYQARTSVARIAARAAGLVIIAAIGITYSRGAFITIAMLVAGLSIWRLVRPRRLVAAVAIAAVMLIAIAPSYLTRMSTILDTTAIVAPRPDINPDGAIRGRATEFLAAFLAFAHHPVLGVGPGQYAPFYSEAYQQRPEVKFRQLSEPREAHNLFVSIAAETGLVGLGVFLAIYLTLLQRLRRARHYWLDRDPELAGLATACVFSLLAYLGTGVFLHLAYERYQALLLGVAGAALQIMRMEAVRRRALSGGDRAVAA